MSKTMRLTTPSETREFFSQIMENAIIPNAGRIEDIAADGDVSVVVYEPGAEMKRFARVLGWDKFAGAVRLRPEHAARLSLADTVTRNWFRRQKPGVARIFLITQGGTFLINRGPGGYYLEPGSTDAEMAQSRN